MGFMEIKIIKGDITKIKVEAIVNAANETLLGPAFARELWRAKGGVDGAIHAAAGPELLKECEKLCGCKTGEAKITKGYDLPAKYVIHTVGPVYGGETRLHQGFGEAKAELLANCYKNCLELAKAKGIRAIAFPAISTGVYGYPKDEAAQIAATVVKEFISKNQNSFDEILFVLNDADNFKIYNKLI
jgi:O-acetyl-ADP-ribose deacetylase (regulator of RNase III)